MSKVHLIHYNTASCCDALYVTSRGNSGTYSANEVTCKSCKKTHHFKEVQREQAKQEAKEIIKNMEKKMGTHHRDTSRDELLTCSDCKHNNDGECTIDKRLEFIGENCADWSFVGNLGGEINYTEDAIISFKRVPKSNDPAIDLLNEIAELIKISELTTDEKLKVVDFIESRVRQGKL